MVFFDLSFRSISTEDIVEDERALWTEGIISWLSINRGSYYFKRVQVIYGDFRPCVVVLSGGGGVLLGGFLERFDHLVAFLCVLSKQNSKPKNRTACRPTSYLLLTIP